ncbi:hypothetical protein ACSSS7_005502 [Eimeria intestinalis]
MATAEALLAATAMAPAGSRSSAQACVPTWSSGGHEPALVGGYSEKKEKREVEQVMNRYAYSLASHLQGYACFIRIWGLLWDRLTSREVYQEKPEELRKEAGCNTSHSRVIAAYLRHAFEGLRRKWGWPTAAKRGLIEILEFFEKLSRMHEAQQIVFEVQWDILQMQSAANRPAQMAASATGRRFLQAVNQLDAATGKHKKAAKAAILAANECVKEQILVKEYVKLLPLH